jgi:hypothetical protein
MLVCNAHGPLCKSYSTKAIEATIIPLDLNADPMKTNIDICAICLPESNLWCQTHGKQKEIWVYEEDLSNTDLGESLGAVCHDCAVHQIQNLSDHLAQTRAQLLRDALDQEDLSQYEIDAAGEGAFSQCDRNLLLVFLKHMTVEGYSFNQGLSILASTNCALV